MELIKSKSSKDTIASILHIVFNVIFAFVLFWSVQISESIFLPVALVLISKWRVLTVRRQYWLANMIASIVDLSVSLGLVGLMYLAQVSGLDQSVILNIQLFLTAVQVIWLTVLKGLTSEKTMQIQAFFGLFLSSWALFAFSYVTPQFILVLLMFVVGFGVAKHWLMSLKEENSSGIISIIFGLLIAELSWVFYFWNISYGDAGQFKIPQAAIVLSLFGFAFFSVYVALKRKIIDSKSINSFIWGGAAVILIFVLLILFSSEGPGII